MCIIFKFNHSSMDLVSLFLKPKLIYTLKSKISEETNKVC